MLARLSYWLVLLTLVSTPVGAQVGDTSLDYLHKNDYSGTKEKTVYVVKGPCSFGNFYVSPANFTEMILDENQNYGGDFTHTGTLKLGTKEFKFGNAKLCNSMILEKTDLLAQKTDEATVNITRINEGIAKNAASFQKRKDGLASQIAIQEENISASDSKCEDRKGIWSTEMDKLLEELSAKYSTSEPDLENKKPLEQIAILEKYKNANDANIAAEVSASLQLYNRYLAQMNGAVDTNTSEKQVYLDQKNKLEKLLDAVIKEENKVQQPLYDALVKIGQELEVYNKQLETAIVASKTYKNFAEIPKTCGFEFKDVPIPNTTGAYFESTQDNDLCRCDHGINDGKAQFMCYRTIGTTNVKAQADKIITTGKSIKIEPRKYIGNELKGKGDSY